MKIAVITLYDSGNYGAYLQAYCMKLELESLGHEVVFVKTRPDEHVRGLYYHLKPKTRKEKVFFWRFRDKVEFGKRKYELFSESQKVFHIVDKEDCSADMYILGSDEIWNIKKWVFRWPIFWGVNLSPVVAYAPSINTADMDDYKDFPELIDAVKEIKSVLVRDAKTQQFVREIVGRDSELVCDPTMLVDVNSYGEPIEDSFLVDNDCMLIYAYKLTYRQQQEIKKSAKKLNVKMVACCFQHTWCDYYIDCRPLQFSALIRQSRYVFTTTFHGSIFCALNGANFVTYATADKTKYVLNQLDLKNKLIETDKFSGDEIVTMYEENDTDYEKVAVKVSELRKKSEALLKNAILMCGE